jgi:NADPH:quinone reductase
VAGAPMKALVVVPPSVSSPHGTVVLESRADPVIGPGDVLVEVRFAGVNQADVLQVGGGYPAPPGWPTDVPGIEVAGTVTRVGLGAGRFRTGDRVFGLVGGGGLAELVRARAAHLAPIPAALADDAAAAVPEAFITAHDALREQGRLRPGQTVLVTGAAGAVGLATIQVASVLGARVLGAARTPAALMAVRRAGGIPIADKRLEEGVADVTAGHGVDLVVELVGAPHFPAILNLVAVRGRLVVVGVRGGDGIELSLRTLMYRRLHLVGTILRGRSDPEKALAVRRFHREVVPLLAEGRVVPLIDRQFPAAEGPAAFHHLRRRGRVGKTLIRFGAPSSAD